MGISVIIPTLNERGNIDATLRALEAVGDFAEVVVCDGGSEDGTAAVARERARVVQAPRGRGSQLNAGAEAAKGDVLLFLHADARLPEGADQAITAALQNREVVGGYFRVLLSGKSIFDRALTLWYDFLRRIGIVYGDAGIFIRRSVFDQIGGFRNDYPILEDLDFYKRLRRTGPTEALPDSVLVSSRRWERPGGAIRTWTAWCIILLLYRIGVHPGRLTRLYPAIR